MLAQVIIAPDDIKKDNFTLFYYKDTSGLKTIEEISKYSFTNKITNQVSLKHQKGSIWFKIEIENKSQNRHFILKAFEAYYETFNLYEYKNNTWYIYKNGLNIDINDREIKDKLPVMPFEVEPNKTKTLYVEITSMLPYMIDFEIYQYDSYFKEFDSIQNLLYMFYFGCSFIIIIFNLFLYISIKDIVVGYYVGYIFSFNIFVFVASGYNIEFGLQKWHYNLIASSGFFIAFLILFTKEILTIKQYNKNLTHLLNFLAILVFALAILVLIDIEIWFHILNGVTMIVFPILLFTSVYAWKKNNADAKIYFFAFIIYIIATTIFALISNAWIKNSDFGRYAYYYASFIEIILFSFLLAIRFHRVNKEKLHIVNELRNKEKLLQEQSRLAQMGEMINMIAHQWRQPLGAINSALLTIDTKLKMNRFDLSKADEQENLIHYLEKKQKNIYEYVEFLSTTIDDFRNFFKKDKEKQKVSLIAPIKKSLQIVGASLENKNIKLFETYNINPTISLYENEMIQVFLNILKNSEDSFLEKNIHKREIHITTKEKNANFYSITICDTAGGIDSKIIDKIFDPYFSTKNEKNGTGLGLYISKMIIETHHDGKLNVYNHQNGICFEIILQKGK